MNDAAVDMPSHDTGMESRRLPERDYNLDLLKGIAIILVVLWHTTMLDVFTCSVADKAYVVLSFIMGIFYSNVTLLAVPTFYLVSLYLFFSKQSEQPAGFMKRVLRIAYVYVFWISVVFAVYYGTYYFEHGSMAPSPPLIMLTVGGPALLEGGYGTPFYYLFDLIVLYILSYFYLSFGSIKAKNILSLILVPAFIAYFQFHPQPINNWTLDNFLIYIPIVYLFCNNRESFLKFRYAYLLCFVLSSIHEIFFAPHLTATYARVSLCFGATALFSFINAYAFKPGAVTSPIVRFLSGYTLGIYALHTFVVFFLWKFTIWHRNLNIMDLVLAFPGSYSGLKLYPLSVGLATFAICIVLAPILARTPLKRMVT